MGGESADQNPEYERQCDLTDDGIEIQLPVADQFANADTGEIRADNQHCKRRSQTADGIECLAEYIRQPDMTGKDQYCDPAADYSR